jgi:hypothetical protein
MRILKLLCLALGAAALATTPVLAQATDSDTINLSGTQAQTCTLGAFSAGAATGALDTGDLTSPTAVSLTDTMSSITAIRAAGSNTLNAAAMCNYGHFVSVRQTGGGLINGSDVAPAQGTFIRKQGYVAIVSWASQTANAASEDVTTTPLVAAVTSTDRAISGAASGTLSLTLSVAASTLPVVAGAYTDSVLVQIGADL